MKKIEEMTNGMELSEFLLKCRVDFKFFCEKVLGFIEYGGIHDFQMEWFKLVNENNRVMIKAPSGFSKTSIVGVAYPLWLIIFNKNLKILLVSKTLTQSKDALLIQIKNHIEENELLTEILAPKDKDTTWSQTQLRTKNGCSLINRPYSINIRGYRANIIILDEIDSYEDSQIYFDYVVPRLIPGGKIIGISTPEEGTSTLMELIQLRDMNYNQYEFKTYTAIVNCEEEGKLETGSSIWPEMFPIGELMRRRGELGEQMFQKNYMCNSMVESEFSIFQAVTIDKCKDYTMRFKQSSDSGSEIYIGLDFAISTAPTGDFDAYTVVERKDGVAIIIYAERHKGLPVPQKVERIQELYQKYKPINIIADESGIGIEIIRQLRLEGLPVISQSFQSRERNFLLNNLKALMENRKLVIPKNPEDIEAVSYANILEHELFSFQEVKSKQTGGKVYVSKSSHDDTAISLAMAVKFIKIQRDFEDSIVFA